MSIRRRWSLVAVLAVLLVLDSFSIREIGMRNQGPPAPRDALTGAWIPQGAEVLPDTRVRPGTFTVLWDLNEFKLRFPRGGLVSFSEYCSSTWDSDRPCEVKIWRERAGSVIFDEVRQIIRTPFDWPAGFYVSGLREEGGQLFAKPQWHTPGWVPLLGLVLFLAGVAIIFLIGRLGLPAKWLTALDRSLPGSSR